MFTVSLPFSPDFGLLLFHHDHLVVLEELYLDVVESWDRHSLTGRKKNNSWIFFTEIVVLQTIVVSELNSIKKKN